MYFLSTWVDFGFVGLVDWDDKNSCSDLNGRRVRTVNAAKQMNDYIEMQSTIAKEKRIRITRKIKEGLKEKLIQKPRFNDPAYFEDKEKMVLQYRIV